MSRGVGCGRALLSAVTAQGLSRRLRWGEVLGETPGGEPGEPDSLEDEVEAVEEERVDPER